MKYTQIGCFGIADAYKDSKIKDSKIKDSVKDSVKDSENKDSALSDYETHKVCDSVNSPYEKALWVDKLYSRRTDMIHQCSVGASCQPISMFSLGSLKG